MRALENGGDRLVLERISAEERVVRDVELYLRREEIVDADLHSKGEGTIYDATRDGRGDLRPGTPIPTLVSHGLNSSPTVHLRCRFTFKKALGLCSVSTKEKNERASWR